ncbi:MAG: nuclear transport factor 2 family protein [Candidatus Binatia bacterium]|nr:nuclear transport factor 2 family protein [Candidatus Binatia bacterium]
MTADHLLAREAIRDTVARYNLAGDRGRLEELAACFCEDGVLEIRGDWEARGREAILERLVPVRENTGAWAEGATMRHHLTTHRAEIRSATEADAWTYFLVVTDRGLDHSGRYVDRLRKVGGEWLLSHRSVLVDWRSGTGRFALPSAS